MRKQPVLKYKPFVKVKRQALIVCLYWVCVVLLFILALATASERI